MLRHLGNIVQGFFVGWDAAIFRDSGLASVVSGDGTGVIAMEEADQILEVARSAFEIFLHVKAVFHPEALRGGRNQLHETLRALVRNGERVVVALGLDHGVDQGRFDFILQGNGIDEIVEFLARRGRRSRSGICYL